ncbi:hypothetical protein [uncultured Selenomonas sp.]|jgi:hypothetical protein|uniref:hypothetical protein n=1 Tax=uncultured Selenomonas sp. TaxID=159275 RepID=UPI0028DC0D97|nr:hypothetical protein [uncultured Selenomonas sp.]
MNKEDFDEMDWETQEILDRLSPAPEKLQEEGWNSRVQQQMMLEENGNGNDNDP